MWSGQAGTITSRPGIQGAREPRVSDSHAVMKETDEVWLFPCVAGPERAAKSSDVKY